MRFIDVKKAHLNGIVEDGEKIYVELPADDAKAGMCARLNRWLYGMRPAASAWEKDYAEKFESVGFSRGVSAPTVFFNPELEVRCVVHGDDFTFLGAEDDLDVVTEHMESWYDLKVRGTLGGGPGDMKNISILNRQLTWVGDTIEYEADPKHVSIICEEFGLGESSKGL